MLMTDRIYEMDCINFMKQLDDESVDMYFADLPYGVTAKNKWDNVIPFEAMWAEVERTIKPCGAILFFGQDKFTARLMLSNARLHRYNIVWKKVLPSGFLNANRMPLREHEDIAVFYKRLPAYNPQKVKGEPCHGRGKALGSKADDVHNNSNYRGYTILNTESDMKHPTSVWEFAKPHPSVAVHPTQKPLDLCRYAIRTYSNAGDLVVDFCCGSGTIPLAAKLEGRHYLGNDNGFCEKKNSMFDGWTWAKVAEYRIEHESGTE